VRIFREAIFKKREILLSIAKAVFVILAAEAAVRAFSLDWRCLERIFYYQGADVSSHQVDPDPRILFRLKPGRIRYGDRAEGRFVTINSFGARGPERQAKKLPGVSRIVCVGGSNVYGSNVSDEEAWPTRLEDELNRSSPGRFEVWNFGTSSYVGVQMAAIAREAVEKLEPDLVIYTLSNMGPRAFLRGSPTKPFFDSHPELWRELFVPAHLPSPKLLSYKTKLWLLEHIGLYRCYAASIIMRRANPWIGLGGYIDESAEATRGFLEWSRGRVKTIIFITPGDRQDFAEYYRGFSVPVVRLDSKGLPDDYRQSHPSARVLAWYAAEMAKSLRDQGIVPQPGG